MTVNDFLKSVIVALEEQALNAQAEVQTNETPKKEETSERKELSNAEFLTATLCFGIGEDDAELLDKLIRDATPSNMRELQNSINSFFSSERPNKEDDENSSNTAEAKEEISVKDQLEMAKADVEELKRIIANLRNNNNDLAKANQELRVENRNLRIENEAMAKQCDSLNQELKRVKDDCDALKTSAQTIVKLLTQK
mgnify:CR=1 FL=1